MKTSDKFPKLKNDEVVLSFAELATGIVLKTNKKYYLGQGERYFIFDSFDLAIEFAKIEVKSNPKIQCHIYREVAKPFYYITHLENKEIK